MKKIVRSTIVSVAKAISDLILFILYKSNVGHSIIDLISARIRNNTMHVNYRGMDYTFSVPNAMLYYRIRTFSTKEPETLEWIDKFHENAVVWDIGANVGLYSIYAAKTKNSKVFAFEPSVFNLEFLARNINHNKVSDLVSIIPIPLSDNSQINVMRMSSTEWGGALSSFEKNIGWDGKEMNVVFDYKVLGISMHDACDKMVIPYPDYIKLDVDGIEHFILSGGGMILQKAKGVLIEINADFAQQAEMCENILKEAGLKLTEKRHSAEFDEEGAFGGGTVWNQIWTRG